MIFQKFVGSVYSFVMEILLWLIPLAGLVSAGIFFSGKGVIFHIPYAFLGLVGGLILDVILFGPIIIILNIKTSLENIENK